MSPVRLTAEKRNITFTADDAGCEDKVILADQLNLEKIILNLLTNAVKYTNEGGKVDFTVRAEDVCSDDAKSLNTVFTVKDNGIGISEDFIPHMFEPFAQENQSGFESSGTGLGLAIVKQIVDLMGGTIDVESSKGSGTMFTVRLCFPKIESDQETSEAAADKNLAILNGKKILVCEDNSLNSEIVSALLCSKGMAVKVAADGQQGVDAFAASQIGEFAAILMDIRMPVLNGFEAARKIRALDRSDALSVPIIAVTANAFDEDKQESVDAGMIGTGIGGFIHLLPLGFGQLVVLYAFWGVTSLFAFWPACIKAVRIMSGGEDQGKAFGYFEGGRGIAAALMAIVAVACYRWGCGKIDNQVLGMKYVIIFYSVLTIAFGIFAFFTIKEGEKLETERISFKGIGQVLKMPAVWIIGIVTFCNYVFTLSLYYFTPYLTDILGATVTFAATLAALKRWFSLFGNIGGGYVTDKVGAGRLLLISFIIMAVGTVAMLMLPTNKSSIMFLRKNA